MLTNRSSFSKVVLYFTLFLVTAIHQMFAGQFAIGDAVYEYVDNQLIVKFSIPLTTVSAESLASLYECRHVNFLLEKSTLAFWESETSTSLFELCDTLLSDSLIERATLNLIPWQFHEPNDDSLHRQWYLDNSGQDGGRPGADISAFSAWDIQTGRRSVKAAIFDRGFPVNNQEIGCCTTRVFPWPDLSDTIKFELGLNYIDQCPGNRPSLPNISYDLDGLAMHGHGGGIAAILGASHNNFFGIAGVVDSCIVYSVKGWSKVFFMAAAEEAVNAGVKVINVSWGWPVVPETISDLQEYEEVVQYLYEHDVILVAASGNLRFMDFIAAPAAFSQWGMNPEFHNGYSNVIAVTGTDRWDSLYCRYDPVYDFEFQNSKSNDSLRTWVSAPAESLLTVRTFYDAQSDANFQAWDYWSGTSFAAPQVVGLAALILSQDSTLTPDTVRQIIALTADKVWQDTTAYPDSVRTYVAPPDTSIFWAKDYWQWHPEYGFGRINCYEALRYLIWEDSVSVLRQGTTTWAEDTTIILHGDIVINPGCTLVVDQGAVIRGSSYDVTASGHADWLSEVIVAGGVLDINGTSNNPVSFIGKIDRPGQWYGIKVDSGTFTYDYLNMTNEFYDFRWDYTLDSNTTWSGTVILRGDIVIPSGVTLTIEDSTTIEVEDYDVSQYKGVDSSLIEIVVDYGTLRINGTSDFPVKFTYADSQDTGKRVDWYGIRVKEGKFIMSHAEVRNAYAGVTIQGTVADTVSNSYFVDCGMYGLRVENDHVLIKDSKISGVDPGYGIYVYQSDIMIEDDSIWACETGIHTSQYSDVSIDNVRIVGPGHWGAYLSSSGDTTAAVTVNNLSIVGTFENSHLGLGASGRFEVTDANMVSDTSERSPYIVIAGLPTKFKLRHSNIKEYSDAAFGLAFCDGRKWDLGVGNKSAGQEGRNNIYSSDLDADYFYEGSEIEDGNLLARYNYWGASPPDSAKFATLGTYAVDYVGYASSPYAKLALFEQAEVSPVLPSAFSLSQNYPNPFNPSTMISYTLPVKGHVQLSIYNILGQRVRQLVDQEQQPGFYQTLWDGTDQKGRDVASGIYLYKLSIADLFQQTRKMIMMK